MPVGAVRNRPLLIYFSKRGLYFEDRYAIIHQIYESDGLEVCPLAGKQSGKRVMAQNRKAFHDYFVEDRFEAGISLVGTEVKSIRQGTLNLKDSFCIVKNGEIVTLFYEVDGKA